jgi:hypothetical protein
MLVDRKVNTSVYCLRYVRLWPEKRLPYPCSPVLPGFLSLEGPIPNAEPEQAKRRDGEC